LFENKIPQYTRFISTLKLPKNRQDEAKRVRAKVDLIDGTKMTLVAEPSK
jgi:hypothetical protein